MKTRGIIGRTITAIRQIPVVDQDGNHYRHVEAIVLDNGWRLVSNVVELGDSYAVELLPTRPDQFRPLLESHGGNAKEAPHA